MRAHDLLLMKESYQDLIKSNSRRASGYLINSIQIRVVLSQPKCAIGRDKMRSPLGQVADHVRNVRGVLRLQGGLQGRGLLCVACFIINGGYQDRYQFYSVNLLVLLTQVKQFKTETYLT